MVRRDQLLDAGVTEAEGVAGSVEAELAADAGDADDEDEDEDEGRS